MCRLTEKNKKFVCTECLNCMEGHKIEDQYYKLQDLEDIEEELGIDLITLFKALKGSIFYIDFDGKLNSAYRPYMVLGDHYYIFALDNIHIGVRDYGKTWALTKEELLEGEEC